MRPIHSSSPGRPGHARVFAWALIATIASGLPLAAGMPAPWRWAGAFPSGADLSAVWAAATDDVFVGGTEGTVLRWNGAEWTTMDTPTQKTIYDIHGLGPSDVWAVGGDEYTTDPLERGVILHFDGAAWTEIPSPVWAGWTHTLGNVFAVAADDVWAIPVDGTLVAHWDGATWALDNPLPIAEGHFYDLAATGSGEVFIVGSHGQIFHRAGGVWATERKTETGPVSTDLILSVWAFDAGIVWAGNNAADVLERQVDGTWSAVDLDASCQNLSIWGFSASEIYLVGDRCVRLFDGAAIQRLWTFATESREAWADAHGAGSHLFVVGAAGVTHDLEIGAGPQLDQSALSVGMRGGPVGRALAGTTPYADSLVLAWGKAEIVVVSEGRETPFDTRPPGGDDSSVVLAVLAPAADDLYLSWEDYTLPPYDGGNYHWNGTAWRPIRNSFGSWTPPVTGLWATASGSVFGVTSNVLWRFSAGTLVEEAASLPAGSITFSAISGSSASHILLGSTDGRVYLFDGSDLTQEATPASGAIRLLAGYNGSFYAVGDDGLAWWRNPANGIWSQLLGVELRSGESFNGLAAGPDGMYATQSTAGGVAGGSKGRIWRFTDDTGEIVASGLAGRPQHIVQTRDGYLFAANPSLWAAGVTTRPIPADLSVQRLSGTPSVWEELGATGVSLLAEGPGWTPTVMANVSSAPLRISDVLQEINGPDWRGIPYTTLKKEVQIVTDETWVTPQCPAEGDWMDPASPCPPESPATLPVPVKVKFAVPDLMSEIDYDDYVPDPDGTLSFFREGQRLVQEELVDYVEMVPLDTDRLGNPELDPAVEWLTRYAQNNLSTWTVGVDFIFIDGFETGDTSRW